MKMFSARTYRFYRAFLLFINRIIHPVVHVSGRENIPEGPVILAGNHSSISDPIWIIACADLPVIPRTMAKKELLEKPILGWLLRGLGVFPVDREGSDVGAIKTAMKTIRDGNKLLIFPEGTRVRKGKKSEPHNGAMLIATRMQTKVLPIYVTAKKKLFRKIDVVFGEPYLPQTAEKRATEEELTALTEEMMLKIYSLGEGL